jgi:ATP-binding cassette subfamily B protein
MKKINQNYKSYQILEAQLSVKLQENLSNIRIIKALSKHEYEEELFSNLNKKQLKVKRKHIFFFTAYRVTSMFLAWSFRLSGFVIGVVLAIQGQISIGTYIAFVGIISNVIWPMRQLNAILIELASSLVSLSRITEVFFKTRENYRSTHSFTPSEIKGEIVFKDVYFSYDNKINTLKGITFHCKPDTIIALLGTNGSGKTSLINLLPRFHDYTKGGILLDGIELKDYPLEFLRKNIGIVEQEPFLFSCSIAENIALCRKDNINTYDIESAAKSSYIYDEIALMPDAFDTIVGENGAALSGGQRQRVAIARAFFKDPRILILDDAMSSVDVENEVKIRMALKELMKNRTTFIIAHKIQSVLMADTIIVLDAGVIKEMGSHKDLVNKNGMYSKMYQLQTEQKKKEIFQEGNK